MIKEDVPKIFQDSIKNIISQNPAERTQLLEYMASVAFCDSNMFQNEMDFLFETGERMLGLTRRETAQIMAATLQQGFIPELYK